MSAPITVVTKPDKPGVNAKEFEQIDKDSQKAFSYVLLTVFHWNEEEGLLKRIYSSSPEAYPVGGSKKMQTSFPWPQKVLVAKQPHFCKNRDDIKATFSDYQGIFDLGCYSQLSIPLIDKDGTGKVLGAINWSGGDGVYTDETEEVALGFQKQGLEALKTWLASQ